eukprot:8595825-Pyramimonas_sp.AAC.1
MCKARKRCSNVHADEAGHHVGGFAVDAGEAGDSVNLDDVGEKLTAIDKSLLLFFGVRRNGVEDAVRGGDDDLDVTVLHGEGAETVRAAEAL